jgi:hypothetical protein
MYRYWFLSKQQLLQRWISHTLRCRLRLKCDGTRAETRYLLSAKRTSPFKSAGASVQSTTDSRGVRISVSNAGYTMFRGSVKSTGYPLHSPVPFTSPPVRHRVPSHFNWTLHNGFKIPETCILFNIFYDLKDFVNSDSARANHHSLWIISFPHQ